MPDTKITALTAIGANPIIPSTFPIPMVDLTDTSMAASGTTKKVTVNQILGAGGTATLASATITGGLTVQSNVNAPANVSLRYGPSGATWAGLRFDSTNQTFLDSDIALIFRTGGATSFTTAYQIGATGISTWSVGGSTAMTLNSTGLGVGVSPSYRLDVQGQSIRLNSGSATGFALLRLGGTASDSFFGFAGNANDIVTGTSAGDTVIGSNKAGANLRFISGNGVLNATLDASGNLNLGVTSPLINTTRRLSVSGTVAAALQSTGAATVETINVWHTATSGNNIFVDFDTEAAVTSRGSISYNRAGGLVAYNTTSDYRAKDIIGPVSNSGSLIDSLKVYVGKMKGATIERPMLIAHETQEVAPYAVTGTKDEVDADGKPKYQQMDASALVPLLIAEIQSLRARVQTLETR